LREVDRARLALNVRLDARRNSEQLVELRNLNSQEDSQDKLFQIKKGIELESGKTSKNDNSEKQPQVSSDQDSR